MASLSIINRVKYSKSIFRLYNFLGSLLITLLKCFLRPDDKLIIFASFGGRKYDDSPKAIYEAMINDSRFDDFKLVWAFMHPEQIEIPRGEKVKIDTLSYYKILLRAKVWVHNSSMNRGLSFKGINVFELNTWHGSAIKRMGGDINEGNSSFSLKSSKRNNGVLLAQGQFDVDVFSRAFQMPVSCFKIIGLPRNDVLAHTCHGDKTRLKKLLGIDPAKKVILYAPTFREYEKDNGNNCIMTPPMNMNKWKAILGENYVLLFRAHYEVAKLMGVNDDDFVKNVSAYPNLEELMIASDMLISDYSSIFFDYAILKRPMLCFDYDYDRYEKERGMYFDIRDYMPHANNEDELLKLILSERLTQDSVPTMSFLSKFVTAYGSASKKSLDIIIENI